MREFECFLEGLEVLAPLMKRYDTPERHGNVVTIQVLFEEVEANQLANLLNLGWSAVDDWMGFEYKSYAMIEFNKWFDEQKGEVDAAFEYAWLAYSAECLARRAFILGVSRGT